MHETHIIQAVEVHTGGGNGVPSLGPVNAFTTENVKKAFTFNRIEYTPHR